MTNETAVISGGVAIDDRGSLRFVNDFNFKNVKRFYQIENHKQGSIRSWHGHLREGKYVYVVRGSALIGAVSLDGILPGTAKQPTDKVNKFVLSSQQPKVLWIPPGYANGIKTLEADTIVMFFSTSTLEESKGDDIRFPYDHWDIWTIEPR